MLAILLGGLIGFEREQSNHAAGLRTNILVCLGSCLLMLLSIYGFSDFVNEVNVRVDPARLAAAVITGIGFLGAGTILFTGKAITGLTTAASLWVVSAIGLAVGAGFYFASSAATVLVLIILYVLNKVEKRFLNAKKEQLLVVRVSENSMMMDTITKRLIAQKMKIRKIEMIEQRDKKLELPEVLLNIYIFLPNGEIPWALVEEIRGLEGVHAVSME
ncbi:MgtC/SapB family protein [Paenibacillus abyssi]|nr:MgtC/SapB family protein [Paenibacillus abyssi]